MEAHARKRFGVTSSVSRLRWGVSVGCIERPTTSARRTQASGSHANGFAMLTTRAVPEASSRSARRRVPRAQSDSDLFPGHPQPSSRRPVPSSPAVTRLDAHHSLFGRLDGCLLYGMNRSGRRRPASHPAPRMDINRIAGRQSPTGGHARPQPSRRDSTPRSAYGHMPIL